MIIQVDWINRHQAWHWAQERNIKIQYSGSNGLDDLWLIENEKHAILFSLRWA